MLFSSHASYCVNSMNNCFIQLHGEWKQLAPFHSACPLHAALGFCTSPSLAASGLHQGNGTGSDWEDSRDMMSWWSHFGSSVWSKWWLMTLHSIPIGVHLTWLWSDWEFSYLTESSRLNRMCGTFKFVVLHWALEHLQTDHLSIVLRNLMSFKATNFTYKKKSVRIQRR